MAGEGAGSRQVVTGSDRLEIRERESDSARYFWREQQVRLQRAKDKPVLPHQRWDYSPPHPLPGETNRTAVRIGKP